MLDAHWGIPGTPGVLSRFVYGDIGSIANNGGYQFFEGGTDAKNSGTNVGGDWKRIKDADWLEVGVSDHLGWPCIEWADVTSDDFIVYEPSSSQWVAFDVASVHRVAGGYRIGIARTRRVSDGGGANVAITPGALADFYLSVDRRPVPNPLKGAATYDGSARAGSMNWSEDDIGYFGFFNSRTAIAAANVLDQISEVVKQAVRLRMNNTDEHGNEFGALDLLVPGHFIHMEVLDTGSIAALNSWAAWKITAVNRDVEDLTILDIELHGFRVNRSVATYRFPPNADVVFHTTPLSPPGLNDLAVRVRPIGDIAAATAVTSIPYTADITGPGAATAASIIGKAALSVIDTSGSTFYREGGRDIYRVSVPVISADRRTATGTITIPAVVQEDTRIILGIRITAVYSNERRDAADNEVFEKEGLAGATVLATPNAPTLETTGGRLLIHGPPGVAGQAGWEYRYSEVDTDSAFAALDPIAGAGVNLHGQIIATQNVVTAGTRYYVRTRRLASPGSRTHISSAWSPSASIVVSSDEKLGALSWGLLNTDRVGGTPLGSGQVRITRSGDYENATGWQYRYSTTLAGLATATARTGGGTITDSRQHYETVSGLTPQALYYFQARLVTTKAGYVDADWSVPQSIIVNSTLLTPFVDRETVSGPPWVVSFGITGFTPGATSWEYVVSQDRDQLLAQTPVAVSSTSTRARLSGSQYMSGQTWWLAVRSVHPANAKSNWSAPTSRVLASKLSTPTLQLSVASGRLTATIGNLDANATGWYWFFSGDQAPTHNGVSARLDVNQSLWRQVVGSTTLSDTVTLTETGTVYAWARAYSSNLAYTNSDWSNRVQSAVSVLADRLATPSFSLAARDEEVRVSLTAALDSDATHWEIRVDQDNTEITRVASGTTSTDIEDLTNGTEYDFEVRAIDTSGVNRNSDWSVIQSATPSATAPATQLAVPTFTLTAGNNLIAVVRNPLAPEANGWSVRFATTLAGLSGDGVSLSTGVSSYNITGLVNGQQYYVELKQTTVADGYSDSDWSPAQTQTPQATAKLPRITATLTGGNGQFRITRNGALDSRATGWEYRYSTSSRGGGIAIGAGTDRSRTVTGRTNGTTYWVQVRQVTSQTGVANSDWSDPLSITPSATTRTLAPLTMTLTPGDTLVTVGRSGLDGEATAWEVRYATTTAGLSGASTANGRLFSVTTANATFDVTGLTNGTLYWFQIRQVNTSNAMVLDSNWTTPASATPVAVEKLPKLVVSLTPGDRQILVAVNPLHASASGWQFRWATSEAALSTATNRAGGTNRRNTVRQLTNGTVYYFQAQQISGSTLFEDSDWSDVVFSSPGVAMNRLAFSMAGGNNQVSITRAALHAAASSWEYRYATTADGVTSATPISVSRTASATQTITGLANGTTIYAQVRQRTTTAGWADSAWSITRSATSSAATQLPELTMTLTPGNALVDVTRSSLHSRASRWEIRFATTEAGLSTASKLNIVATRVTRRVTGLMNGTTYWFQIRQWVNSRTNPGFRSSNWSAPASTTPAPLLATITNRPIMMSDGEKHHLNMDVRPTIPGVSTDFWRTTPPLTLSTSETNRGTQRVSSVNRPWIHAPARVTADVDATIDLNVTRGGIAAAAPQVVVPVRRKSITIGLLPPDAQAIRFPVGTTIANVPVAATMNKTFIGDVTYTWTKSAHARFVDGSVQVTLPGLDGSTTNVTVGVTATSGGLTARASVSLTIGNGSFRTDPSHGGLVDIGDYDYIGIALQTSAAVAFTMSYAQALRTLREIAEAAEDRRIEARRQAAERGETVPVEVTPELQELLNLIEEALDGGHVTDEEFDAAQAVVNEAQATQRQAFVTSVQRSAQVLANTFDLETYLNPMQQRRLKTLADREGELTVREAVELFSLLALASRQYTAIVRPPDA